LMGRIVWSVEHAMGSLLDHFVICHGLSWAAYQ